MVDYKIIRNIYYGSVGILILNAFDSAREFMQPVLGYDVLNGITIIAIIAGGVALGTIQAYKRKFG